MSDAEAEFGRIDTNGGGQLLFDEFSHWALSAGLDGLRDDEDLSENIDEEARTPGTGALVDPRPGDNPDKGSDNGPIKPAVRWADCGAIS